jgi:hypothetical protein
MKRHSCTLAIGLVILLFGVADLAQAVPITYTQTGVATGTITGPGGVLTFTDASILMTMIGDTDNVVGNPAFEEDGESFPAGIFFANPSFATTLNIAGIGIVTVTDPSAIYAFPISVDIDEDGDMDPPLVVFGTLDNPPDLWGFTGLGGTASDSLAGYHLDTAIGPITSFGGIGHPPTESVNTDRGVLRFASDINLDSTRGTFTATVPEPGSLLLFGAGLVSVVGARSRFRGPRRTTSN